MARKKIALVGAGQIGGTLALLPAMKRTWAMSCCSTSPKACRRARRSIFIQASPVEGFRRQAHRHRLLADRGADVVIVTAGVPRKPGMSRDDLIGINLKVMEQVGAGIKKYAPNAFVICITNPLDAMVWALQQVPAAAQEGGRHGGRARQRALPLFPRRRNSRSRSRTSPPSCWAATATHGAAGALFGVAGIPLPDLVKMGWTTQERLDAIVSAPATAAPRSSSLLKTGSAFYAPAASAIAMAESYLQDKKRVLPCAAYLNGEYGVKDLYVGVPVVIGAGGVEVKGKRAFSLLFYKANIE
jgi:malate dehydrogenase